MTPDPASVPDPSLEAARQAVARAYLDLRSMRGGEVPAQDEAALRSVWDRVATLPAPLREEFVQAQSAAAREAREAQDRARARRDRAVEQAFVRADPPADLASHFPS